MCCTFVSYVKFKRLSREKTLSQQEVLPKGGITDNPLTLKLYIPATTAIKAKPGQPAKVCLKGSPGATEALSKLIEQDQFPLYLNTACWMLGLLWCCQELCPGQKTLRFHLLLAAVFKPKWINKPLFEWGWCLWGVWGVFLILILFFARSRIILFLARWQLW